mgnify:CR=1 FL=1
MRAARVELAPNVLRERCYTGQLGARDRLLLRVGLLLRRFVYSVVNYTDYRLSRFAT